MQVEKIKELIPEWAEVRDIFFDDDYHSDKAIVILLKDKNAKGLKGINGRDLLKYLNDQEDGVETYGWEYIFESEKATDKKYILNFNIQYEYYILGNCIEITNDKIKISLEEPFDGGGGEEEIEQFIQAYLKEKGVF